MNNNHKIFISYDPLSFLTIIAALCGCISIICPIPNISKKDYFKKTPFYEYMVEKNIDSLYGIAYGNSDEEIKYAHDTLHLLKDLIYDFQKWSLKYVYSFINNLINWELNTNTLLNYIDFLKLDIDLRFYRSYYKDLRHMTNHELIEHYNKYGKKEGRLISKKQLYNI